MKKELSEQSNRQNKKDRNEGVSVGLYLPEPPFPAAAAAAAAPAGCHGAHHQGCAAADPTRASRRKSTAERRIVWVFGFRFVGWCVDEWTRENDTEDFFSFFFCFHVFQWSEKKRASRLPLSLSLYSRWLFLLPQNNMKRPLFPSSPPSSRAPLEGPAAAEAAAEAAAVDLRFPRPRCLLRPVPFLLPCPPASRWPSSRSCASQTTALPAARCASR